MNEEFQRYIQNLEARVRSLEETAQMQQEAFKLLNEVVKGHQAILEILQQQQQPNGADVSPKPLTVN